MQLTLPEVEWLCKLYEENYRFFKKPKLTLRGYAKFLSYKDNKRVWKFLKWCVEKKILIPTGERNSYELYKVDSDTLWEIAREQPVFKSVLSLSDYERLL